MKLQKIFLSGCLLALMLCANCANAQNIADRERQKIDAASNLDLSTKEAVIAELQKIKDAKIAELPTADEKIEAERRAVKLEARNVCIERFKESPRVIVIGSFRHDYGCHFAGAFVDSRFYEANTLEIHQAALAAFGWEKANQTRRQEIARLWVEKGLLAFFTVPQTKMKELENFDSHPPRVASSENGDVKITLWFQSPPRMRRGKSFQHVEYRFKADGMFSGASTLAAVVL